MPQHSPPLNVRFTRYTWSRDEAIMLIFFTDYAIPQCSILCPIMLLHIPIMLLHVSIMSFNEHRHGTKKYLKPSSSMQACTLLIFRVETYSSFGKS